MLLLRKRCQPLLDKLGLHKLHITVDGSKYLVIAGKCGQTIMSINAIRFNSSSIVGEEEREYAVELLEAYLDSYEVKLLKYVELKESQASLENTKVVIPSNVAIHSTGYGKATRYLVKVNAGTKRLRYTIQGYCFLCDSYA